MLLLGIGIFLFGALVILLYLANKQEAPKEEDKSGADDVWVLGKIDSKLGSGMLRFRQNPSMAKADYPWLVMVTMTFDTPMPTSKDFDVYDEMEDEMEKLESNKEFFLAACVTLNHRRDWLFYARDSKASVPLSEALHKFQSKIEYRFQPNWDEYLALISLAQSAKPLTKSL